MPSWKSERRPSIIRKRILRSGCATCTSRGDVAVACAFTPAIGVEPPARDLRIGAFPILSAETGLHVFETPSPNRSFDRIAVRVAVAPYPSAAPGTDPVLLARRALAELPASTTIVRRYRTGPSPLVRDSVHDWRTGRLDRVLAGDFDVIADS